MEPREREFAIEALRWAMMSLKAGDAHSDTSLEDMSRRAQSIFYFASEEERRMRRRGGGKRASQADKRASTWYAIHEVAASLERDDSPERVWLRVGRMAERIDKYLRPLYMERQFFNTDLFRAVSERFPDVEPFVWRKQSDDSGITVVRCTPRGEEARTLSYADAFAQGCPVKEITND